jgi:hypothetical protein
MVTVVGVVGLLVIVGVNSVVAALMTRFFRVRLETMWGPVVYAVLVVPVVALVIAQVLSGVIGLGFDLGSAGAVVAVTILVPTALGLSFDYLWMPAPEDVELPAEYSETETETRTRQR